jgi:hypothetical protein
VGAAASCLEVRRADAVYRGERAEVVLWRLIVGGQCRRSGQRVTVGRCKYTEIVGNALGSGVDPPLYGGLFGELRAYGGEQRIRCGSTA